MFGGLLRFLADVGGYVPGEDLHVVEYDWRGGIAHAGQQLGETLARLRGAGEERFDLLGMSTGGLAMRWLLAQGPAPVHRVIYVGTPHRGSAAALWHLAEGVQPAPLGKSFAGSAVACFQTSWDALPHPDDPVFVSDDGEPLDLDLYDASTWSRLGLAAGCRDVDRERLSGESGCVRGPECAGKRARCGGRPGDGAGCRIQAQSRWELPGRD